MSLVSANWNILIFPVALLLLLWGIAWKKIRGKRREIIIYTVLSLAVSILPPLEVVLGRSLSLQNGVLTIESVFPFARELPLKDIARADKGQACQFKIGWRSLGSYMPGHRGGWFTNKGVRNFADYVNKPNACLFVTQEAGAGAIVLEVRDPDEFIRELTQESIRLGIQNGLSAPPGRNTP